MFGCFRIQAKVEHNDNKQSKNEILMGIWSKKSAEAIHRIREHRKRCLIIHYGCQSLYDDREGLSPRISNIVVRDLDNEQTFSFAIHLVAEKMKISRDNVVGKFDEIESKLLEEFFQFVRDHPGNLWLHWNMINLQYGFETLAHRYSVLTDRNAPGIEMDNRINIASVIRGKYGENYVGVPHMSNLMSVNGGIKKDFVVGKDEVELFKASEFAKLHASTIAKVGFFSDVIHLVLDGKLKTQRSNFLIKIERATDHAIAKLVGLGSAIYAFIDLGLKAIG